jgi:hypothetical protein
MIYYVIEHKNNYAILHYDAEGEQLFWSNDFGWGNYDGCDKFSEKETEEYNLPIDGEWVTVVCCEEEDDI